MSKKKTRREMLEAVKAHILEEPRRMHMNCWLIKKESTGTAFPTGRYSPPCGTIGCIAGWLCTLFFDKPIINEKGYFQEDPQTVAAELLGFASCDSEITGLFHPPNWPNQFKEELHAYTPGSANYAQVVADRIDYFLETGK